MWCRLDQSRVPEAGTAVIWESRSLVVLIVLAVYWDSVKSDGVGAIRGQTGTTVIALHVGVCGQQRLAELLSLTLRPVVCATAAVGAAHAVG